MACPASRNAAAGGRVKRVRHSPIGRCIKLALAALTWTAGPLHGALTYLPIARDFERSISASGQAAYTWRNSEATASFEPGGFVSITNATGGSIDLSFPGASTHSEPEGEQRSPQRTFYYLGAPGDWRSAEHFERIRYRNIYPGIDLVFLNRKNQLEYNFELAPHAGPGQIRIRFGAFTPVLRYDGSLDLSSTGVAVTQRRPTASLRGRTRTLGVPCRYRIRGQDVLLSLGSYDRSQPLIIDPVLVFSTYLGGSGYDAIYGAAADAAGNLYVTGETSSGGLTNPALAVRPDRDVFVAKLNSTATQVLYLVYLGGTGNDSGKGIALDPAGNAYVTGVTTSANFPVTAGAFTTTAPGPENAFAAKLAPTGNLLYATYLGAPNPSFGLSIAVDASGDAYVAGQTEAAAFPTTTGAFQTSNRGGVSDCFVAKLNPTGNALLYSTLLGGSALDLCSGVAVDGAGDAYVTGTTYSVDFPVQAAMQSSLLGTANAFLAKINPAGSGLLFSTYVGGSGTDNGNAVALDSSGNAYVAGTTSSVNFPSSAGAWQSALYGIFNAFAFKVSSDGSTLLFSTLLGGSGSDTAASLAVAAAGRVLLGGYTSSSNFPTAGAYQASTGGGFDAFAAVLDPMGAALVFSTYLGGAGDDRAYSVVAAPGNQMYLAGMTSSANWPTAAAMQSALSANYDASLAELNYGNMSPPAPVSVTPSSGSGSSQTFSVVYSDGAGASDITSAQILIN